MKKGEKGILILAPIIRKKTENNGETEPDESSTAVGFRAAYVFDITQTDGQPLSGHKARNSSSPSFASSRTPLALARTISEQSTATTTKANAQNARSVRFSQRFSFSLRI